METVMRNTLYNIPNHSLHHFILLSYTLHLLFTNVLDNNVQAPPPPSPPSTSWIKGFPPPGRAPLTQGAQTNLYIYPDFSTHSWTFDSNIACLWLSSTKDAVTPGLASHTWPRPSQRPGLATNVRVCGACHMYIFEQIWLWAIGRDNSGREGSLGEYILFFKIYKCILFRKLFI